VAKALAVRVRFPAWSASVRSRHWRIRFRRKWQQNRVRDLRPRFARTCGYSRSSTAIEHTDVSGRRGFDSHRERQFRRAVEFGLSAKRETASGFKSCPSRQMAGFPSRLLSVVTFRDGPLRFGYRTGSSTAFRASRENGEDAGSIPAQKHRSRLLSIPYYSSHFRRVAGLGYRLLSAWSPVRVRPPAPDAGVAQW